MYKTLIEICEYKNIDNVSENEVKEIISQKIEKHVSEDEINSAREQAFKQGQERRNKILKILDTYGLRRSKEESDTYNYKSSNENYIFYDCRIDKRFYYHKKARFFSFITPVDTKKDNSRIYKKLKDRIVDIVKSKEWNDNKNCPWTRYVVDLARFRIVCCYLSDVYTLACQIGKDFSVDLHQDQKSVKDYIFGNRPYDRTNASKSIHFRFPENDYCRIELQLMTLLHFGWDQIEHPHYEDNREEIENKIKKSEDIVPRRTDIQYWAASDALYIFDEKFMELDIQWMDGNDNHQMGKLLKEWGKIANSISNDILNLNRINR